MKLSNMAFLFYVLGLVLLSPSVPADFDQRRPEGISDSNWSALKTAVEDDKLLPGDGVDSDNFGWSVSLSGDRALIGAPHNDNANDSGSAYIFELQGGSWIEMAKLTASDGVNGDNFGRVVSLSGERALIGAPYDDNGNGINSGSAYVFELQAGSWTETVKLISSDGENYDYFGWSVSLSGNRVLIGALGDDGLGSNIGSAYVFDLQGGSWNEKVKLVASDGADNDNFGAAVSLFGDRALISAPFDDDDGFDSGSVYVFDLQGGSWNESTKLIADEDSYYYTFGSAVSLSDDRALANSSASVYVLDYHAGNWSQTTKLIPNDGVIGFRNSVSLSGDQALIGAAYDNDYLTDFGSAYVFELQGGSWNQTAKLIASDGAASDYFGWSVSLSGDRVLIGAVRDDDNGSDSGSAYIFNHNESGVDLIFCNGFDVVPTDLIFRDGFEDRNC